MVKNAAFSAVVNKTGGTEQEFIKKDIEAAGWQLLDSDQNSGDWKIYHEFINRSSAEFSVAKNTYVKGKTGWFSCRSACYLAMGKPVVTQDTGWSKFIPSGQGLFAFDDLPTAVEAVENVIGNYQEHAWFARQIACNYFDSNEVLTSLLNQVNKTS